VIREIYVRSWLQLLILKPFTPLWLYA